jgi:hypothetical protein
LTFGKQDDAATAIFSLLYFARNLKMRFLTLCLFLLLHPFAWAQFSLGTDVSVLRNSSPAQQFWTVGQTIRAEWYTGPKDGPYLSIGYYVKSKFDNQFSARAKSSTINPAEIMYRANSSWQFRQALLGWKHYFKGRFDGESNAGIYGTIGTGLLFARIENSFSQSVDTSLYASPGPTAAAGTFRRIILDMGLGGEWAIGADVYAFGELRSLLQASETPSPLVAGSRAIPLAASVHAGLRVLIW